MRLTRWSLAAALVLAACQPSGAASRDSAAAKPAVDLAKEEEAIRALDAQWVRAVAARDTAAIVAMYATDALFMMPNAQALGGRDGARKGWAGMLAAPNTTLEFHPTRVVVAQSGDLAYDVGTYDYAADGKTGRTTDKGKYVVVWKKQDGAWKVTADIFNSDLPAAR